MKKNDIKKMVISIGDLIINKFIFANENKNLNFFPYKQDNNEKIGVFLFLLDIRKNLIN